jgi:hypothetical protein
MLTTKNKIGLGLAVLLGLSDLAGVLFPSPDDQPGPPLAVLVVGAVLGVITLMAVVFAWRTGNRVATRVVAATRILSALGTLPAFLVGGVPASYVVAAAASVVLTVIAVGLVLARRSAPAPSPA